MSDESPAPPAPKTDWKSLMDTLFPDGTHVMHDVAGNEYPVRTFIPARREALLVRKLGEVSALPVGEWAEKLAAGAAETSTGGVVGALLGVVQQVAAVPEVLDLLCDAVSIAHPALLSAALAKVRDTAPDLLDGVASPGLADLFDTTELVQCLLPFVLRPANKVLGAMSSIQPRPTT